MGQYGDKFFEISGRKEAGILPLNYSRSDRFLILTKQRLVSTWQTNSMGTKVPAHYTMRHMDQQWASLALGLKKRDTIVNEA